MALLLRLLLITLLLVNTSASAWAATGMAASLLPAADNAHSLASEAMAADCHASTAAEPERMPCGNDSQHCHCLHANPALPCNIAGLPPPPAPAGPYSAPLGGNRPPHLADPVRPPITPAP